VLDLREEQEENASGSVHVNSKYVSNESDLHFEKYSEQRI
jgi:hypothetical protein